MYFTTKCVKARICTLCKVDKAILSTVFIALFFGAFLFTQSYAQAQEADNSVPLESAPSQEAAQDFDISIEDMQANRAAILPDSALHVFKRFGHAITEAVTFDPVAKAELRLEHANDTLAETKQMIEEKGMENVNARSVAKSIERYEAKLGQVATQVDDIRAKREINQESVNAFLNDFINKQLTQQKVLDNIVEEVIEVKEDGAAEGVEVNIEIEQIMATVEDVKSDVLYSFTEVLSEVENSADDMANRLSDVMDAQVGSDFKYLKNLEILEELAEKVPETAKQAIQMAKENTIKKFEVRINTLPPAVRAEKFQNYVEHATVDETRLVTLLDELKQSQGIPVDILEKLEEAKEIAVRKFEEKLEFIDDFAVSQRYFDRFDTTGVDGLIAMEEFKNRMSAESKIGARMEQAHTQSVDAFKKMFNDVDSQYQAERFQMLTTEMMANPNPKTFKLLMQLEEEVGADPTKRAFIDQTEQAMKNQFETRFRREGDKFMNRITSLDPNDIGILENIDFGSEFNGRFVEKNTEHFQNFMRDVEEPEHFDRFRERFFDAPEFVINEIKDKDTGFQDAMMHKMREVEEQRAEKEREIERSKLDYEEREIHFQIDRVQRQKEDEFWNKLNEIPWDDFDARKRLWEEKIDEQYSLAEEKFNEQKRIFDARLANDPFCDDTCRQIQTQFMEQEMRHEKERMADDLVRERNNIEREKIQHQRENPLFDKCYSDEECEAYCRENKQEPGCEWIVYEPEPYVDPSIIDCPMGEFWNGRYCEFDPYHEKPDTLIKCPDLSSQMPMACPAGQHREIARDENGCDFFGDCMFEGGWNNCPRHYEPVCGMDNITHDNDCLANFAGAGIQYYGECEVDIYQECAWGEFWVIEFNKCIKDTDYVPSTRGECDYGWGWTGEYCARDSSVTGTCASSCDTSCYGSTFCMYDNMGCAIGCSPECADNHYYDTAQARCIQSYQEPTAYCGDNICTSAEGEDSYSCEIDCGAPVITPIATTTPDNIATTTPDDVSSTSQCSAERDFFCPTECAAGSDYDCCEDQAGKCWFSGEGCYDCGSTTADCSATSDNICPDNCAAGSDYDCCVYSDKCWENGACNTCSYCGDGACDASETEYSCASDCASSTTLCSEKGITAKTCTSTELCVGEIVPASDTAYCCLGSCTSSGCVSHMVDGPDFVEATKGITGISTDYCINRTTIGDYYCQYLGSPPYTEFEARLKEQNCIDYGDNYICDPTNVTCEANTPVCGDAICDYTETETSCPDDCYVAPTCASNQYNSYTTSTDCNFSECADGCEVDSDGCPNACVPPANSITITSPSASDQLTKGSTYNISWQYSGWEDSQYVHIDVASGSGGFTLFSQNDEILISSGSVSWTIGDKWPNLEARDDWYLRVFAVPIGWTEGVDYDKSDLFSIVEDIAYECTDTDAGKDYYTKGNANSSKSGVDGRVDCCKAQSTTYLGDPEAGIGPGGGPCTDGPYLYEAYCESGNHVPQLEVYECPSGSCSNGVCL